MSMFMLAVGCHLLLTSMFFLLDWKGNPLLWALAETAVVLCVPFFGLLILLLFKLCCHVGRLYRERTPEADDTGEAFFRGTEFDRDIIPLNDAFLVADVQQKRHFFTEAIKQSVVDNQNILQMAMHDRDREIAYYAVSMLTTRMENLETRLFEQESAVLSGEKNEDTAVLVEYVELLREYLAQKEFIDHVTWRKKQGDYIGLLDHLVSLLPERIDYYIEEIRQLLDIRNFRTAEHICEQMMLHFPAREESFLMYIELYQAEHEREKMQQAIAALKASPLELSPKALQVIRFWDKEIQGNG
ncbi:hypothetical protein SAMN02910356_00837 [Selenomonas sp. GACV-9]|uniref:hypothetical protein n=1 Tax=Selenomonas sp. GACV-9 TaxID=3158782 RepID=UPI0008F45214|nr:hypothetical protein SAMN02910356_00837 [Selenomonas ruminantium]